MCGVAGWLAPPGGDGEALRTAVDRMAATLVHRGPDDHGRWTDAAAGIGLGFRRLSVLDPSPTGHQPMLSADGRYVCVFNGEIYNYRDLRAELVRRGLAFRGGSDTEVVANAAAAFGAEATIPRLWGMFALGIWDRVERTLLLARDRLGKKPLYVTRLAGGGWLFASELKAFHAADLGPLEVDAAAVAQYLRFRYVPAPRTIFRHTWKVEPGTFSRLRFGRPLRSERYWDPVALAARAAGARRSEPGRELISELDELLRDAVARRMIADVPLGALLSGGIDSSAVTALMQTQSPRPVRTFSVGFREPGYDEASAAEAVARHLGTEHANLYLRSGEARDVIPSLPEIYDEPFADSSQIPTLLVSRLARQDVTVALSGDGGDEVFAGYDRYLPHVVLAFGSRMPAVARRVLGTMATGVPVGWWDAAYRAARPLLPAGLSLGRFGNKVHRAGGLLAAAQPADHDEAFWKAMTLWPDAETLLPGGGAGEAPWESAGLDADFGSPGERMTLYDLMTYLPDDILTKVDRASMAVSLEVRSPLLDHRIVEWAWRLPFRLKLRAGATKWILRQVLYRYVPPRLVERPKAGFGIPLDHWLRGPLRDWAEHQLRRERLETAGLNPAPVRQAWHRHLAGTAEHHRLWVVLMWIAWRERWA